MTNTNEQPSRAEIELAHLSGKSVPEQRAMGETEWTIWYDQLIVSHPARFAGNGAILPSDLA